MHHQHSDRGSTISRILSGSCSPRRSSIIGARPAMGKTSLELGICYAMWRRRRHPVLIFSLEMGHTELTQRILSRARPGRLAEVAHQPPGRGRLDEDR